MAVLSISTSRKRKKRRARTGKIFWDMPFPSQGKAFLSIERATQKGTSALVLKRTEV